MTVQVGRAPPTRIMKTFLFATVSFLLSSCMMPSEYHHVSLADGIPGQKKILIIGDSQACAVYSKVGLVERKNETVRVKCKVGSTIQYWTENDRFSDALDDFGHADYVIIFLGTNNYGAYRLPNVEPILDASSKAGNCIWVGPTDVRGKRPKISDQLAKTVGPRCSYVDTGKLGIPLGDGIHPTDAGAEKWIREVWKGVK